MSELTKQLNAAAEALDKAARNLVMVADDFTQAHAAIIASHRVNVVGVRDDFEQRKATLKALIEANPAEFAKPRSRTIADVEFGMRKGSKKAKFACDLSATLLLIDQHFTPELAAVIAPQPPRDIAEHALKGLTEEQRVKIGLSYVQGDSAFVKSVGDDAFDRTKEFS